MSSRDQRAKIRYFNLNAPAEVAPLTKEWGRTLQFGDLGDGPEAYRRRRHLVTSEHEVTVVDARSVPGGLQSWKLDTHGFTCVPAPPPVDFEDRARVREEYYPQILELAKKVTGSEHAVMLTSPLLRSENPKNPASAYARFAHADVGPDTEPMLREFLIGHKVLPEEEAWSCDLCMVNIWHPTGRPAYKDPLCLLDCTSVRFPEDVVKYLYDQTLLASGKERPAIPTYADMALFAPASGPVFSPAHRWVYCPDMRPDEAWVLKNYDTRAHVARCSFHNSFHDPFYDNDPNIPGRRSAEFRILLAFPAGGQAAAGAGASRL